MTSVSGSIDIVDQEAKTVALTTLTIVPNLIVTELYE